MKKKVSLIMSCGRRGVSTLFSNQEYGGINKLSASLPAYAEGGHARLSRSTDTSSSMSIDVSAITIWLLLRPDVSACVEVNPIKTSDGRAGESACCGCRKPQANQNGHAQVELVSHGQNGSQRTMRRRKLYDVQEECADGSPIRRIRSS